MLSFAEATPATTHAFERGVRRHPIRRRMAVAIAAGLWGGVLAFAAVAAEPLPPDEDAVQLQALEVAPEQQGSAEALVDERRQAPGVSDLLGSEQMARAGDSDAGAALKRVTGLSLVDDGYVYVRGLGERYSSVLLNGAQLPSPDPTRRVVPLDLFPAAILDSIAVQKTHSADLPAEFGGGAILLRSRRIPDGFRFKVAVGSKWAESGPGSNGLRYDGGDRDWTGFDHDREAPDGLLDADLTQDPVRLEQIGEALAAQGYAVRRDRLGPAGSFSLSLGDGFGFADDAHRLGYLAALRWSQDWSQREEQRTSYGIYQDALIPIAGFDREQSTRHVDASGFLTGGLELGSSHQFSITAMQVRQTTDRARIDSGDTGSGNLEQITTLEWVENALQSTQLGGTHWLAFAPGARVDWQFTHS